MMTAIIVIALVVVFLVGGLLVLRNSGSAGMPGADVIYRAKQRSEQQAAAEHEEDRH
jgi:preprotein translocase subunit SecG